MQSLYTAFTLTHPNTVVLILQGSFYEAYGDSAQILHYLMGYKLFLNNNNKKQTGVPAFALDKVTDTLNSNKVNYIVLHARKIILSKKFNENNYQICLNPKAKNPNDYYDKDSIKKGDTVTFLYVDDNETETYTLVDSSDFDPLSLNIDSPIGKALMHKKLGDIVSVTLPSCIITIKIEHIKFGDASNE